MTRLAALGGRWGEVADGLDRSGRLMRLHVRYNLPALSIAEQLAFLRRTQEPALHRSLTLPFLRREDRGLAARSAEWVINGKAVAHQTQAEQIALARAGGGEGAAEDVRALLAVRAELATLALKPRDEGGTELARRIAALEERQRRLSASLGLGSLKLDRGDPWEKLDEVRKKIPADSVLVEIVDFDLWDFKRNDWKRLPNDKAALAKLTDAQKAQSRYLAWVIPPEGKGDVRLVDLGERWPVSLAVGAYQKAMKDAPRQIQIDEADAEAAVKKALKGVADLVLAPLQPHLGGVKRWLISPDSDLWLVPWAALPLKDGSYAVEKHQISYLISGRDLLRPAGTAKSGPALVLGDPDFDLAPGGVEREVARLGAKPPLALRGPARESVEKVPRDWGRLPGTAEEAKSAAARLEKYTKTRPTVYTRAEAVESVVKAARGPRVLVLATHAFALPEPAVPLPLADGGESYPGRKVRMFVDGLSAVESTGDAMQRCGLVLAGANKRDKKAGPAADDGVLSGTEVLGCDLRGTELVVLSACDTGLGQVNLGEGVSGLRQAFLLAGARSVVASLWKVSDSESAALMGMFWDDLADGKGRADALRKAQLRFIKARRAKEGAAHPFFWAAFSLTGDAE